MRTTIASISASAALAVLVVALATGDASAITIDTVLVGNPGNVPDTVIAQDGTTGYGSVAYAYRIGKYEVTNAQYVEFLNAKDSTGANTLRLYSSEMGSNATFGGIGFAPGNANGSKSLSGYWHCHKS